MSSYGALTKDHQAPFHGGATLSCAHCGQDIARPAVEREQRIRCWNCHRWNRYRPGEIQLEVIMHPEKPAVSTELQPRSPNHAQLLAAHKQDVVEDYQRMGFMATCRKWNVNKNTFNRKLGEWGVAKRSYVKRLATQPAPSPTPAGAEELARSPDYWRGKCEAYERTLELIEMLVHRSLELRPQAQRKKLSLELESLTTLPHQG